MVQYLEQSISHWVTDNGGLSFMIPSVSGRSSLNSGPAGSSPAEFIDPQDYAHELDALILQGGTDVGIDLIRDRYELELLSAFHKLGKPVLGVCRGHQLLNVYFGGTLFPDISARLPNAIQHVRPDLYDKHTHDIQILAGGMLAGIFENNTEHAVVSIHHQAIDRLGDGLRIEAVAKDDGVIEAVSYKGDAFVLGVQWHPEFHLSMDCLNLLPSTPIVNALMQSARARKSSRKARPFGHRAERLEFEKSAPLTLGIELEFQLIDPETRDLKPSAQAILKSIGEQSQKIKSEIFQSMIEVETGVCKNAREADADLSETIAHLSAVCKQHDTLIAASGTHPFASYLDRKITPADRYKELIERNQWIARRLVIFGLHVHVGMPDAQTMIRVMNAFMHYSPLLLGLSASSPFWHEDDTGLASSRTTFFESTPTGGHPIIVDSWEEYEDLYFRMLNSKSIRSPKDLWWDIRPSPHYGTLEIRTCDIMPSVKDNVAIAALIHAMAAKFLGTIKNGQHNPTPSDWQYRENKWRATRHGLDFDFVVSDWGDTKPAKLALLELLNSLSDAEIPDGAGFKPASEIYQTDFQHLREIVERGIASDRIKRVYNATGRLEDTVRHCCDEFTFNRPIWT